MNHYRLKNLCAVIVAFYMFEVMLVLIYSNAPVTNILFSDKYLRKVTAALADVYAYKYTEHQRSCSTIIPCTVWMLWDEGWDTAPKVQRMCLNSFKRNNPEWELRAISLAEAEHLIDRSKYYSDIYWENAKIQAKSDIIRIELLARYGGVWADSTVYCNEPLSNWIDATLGLAKFFVYERRDEYVNKTEKPAIATWFIASANSSRMVQIWRDRVRTVWENKITPPEQYGYFWVHRIFQQLAKNNTEFSTYYKYMTFMDAGGPHCWPDTLPLELRNKTSYIYKVKAPGCVRTSFLKKLLKREREVSVT